MKSKFFFFAAMAMIMATGCAKTFGGSNDPAHGDKDEIRFSSYVNVMTKSGTKATETFDSGDGFVVVGGYEYTELTDDFGKIASSLAAFNTFNTTQVYNEGDAESPNWVPKEIESEALNEACQMLIEGEIFTPEEIAYAVEKCYNSYFNASWLLASNYPPLFDSLKSAALWGKNVHRYWNYNTENPYTFFAFSPASIINDAAITIPYSFLGQLGTVSTRDSYMDGELDIMFATTTVEKQNFGKDVELVFSHLGAKLEFIVNNACPEEIKIHGVALGGTISKLAEIIFNSFSGSRLSKATCSDEMKYHFYIPYITEDMASAMESEYHLDHGYIEESGFNVKPDPFTIPAEDSMTSPIVVCPQIVDTNNNTVLLAYTLGDDTNMYMAEIPLSEFKFDEEELTQWEGGYKYTYKITVNHDEISFKASVANWVDGGEGTVVLK